MWSSWIFFVSHIEYGSIGILAEIGGAWNGPIYFMRVNMKYITDNKDKGPFKQVAVENKNTK